MRIRRVNRYYCDFCKKAGCSAYHLKRHEAACTLNPNRICRLCDLTGDAGSIAHQKYSAIIAMLPKKQDFPRWDDTVSEFGDYCKDRYLVIDAIDSMLPKIRDILGNCPACILAVIRQSGWPVSLVKSFDYANEMRSVISDVDQSRACEYPY